MAPSPRKSGGLPKPDSKASERDPSPALSQVTAASTSQQGSPFIKGSRNSLPVSYAYGAPNVGYTNTTGRRGSSPRGGASRHTRGDSVASRQTVEDNDHLETGTVYSQASHAVDDGPTGRAQEPAAVRYARIAQRKKDIGQPFLPPAPVPPPESQQPEPEASTSQSQSQASKKPPSSSQSQKQVKKPSPAKPGNTSVNIATAFNQALRGAEVEGPGIRKVGGSRAFTPVTVEVPLVQQRVHAMEQDPSEQEEEDEESDGSGKETQMGGNAQAGPSRKRKKRKSADPSFKPGKEGEEEESSEEFDSDDETGPSAKKRARPATEELEDDASPGTKKARRKSHDKSYRPGKDSLDEEDDDESSDADTHRRRRKSSGKGAAGGAKNAIPIGVRDGQVWLHGKKRKGRRGSRTANGEENEHEHDGEGESMSLDNSGETHNGSEAPTASFFLRQRSRSPPTPAVPGALALSSPGGSSRAAASPLRAVNIFRSFGRWGSSARSDEGSSRQRTESFDDSVTRGASYDYMEEERDLAAMEAQKDRRASTSSSTSSQQGGGLRQRLAAGPRRGGGRALANGVTGPSSSGHRLLDGITEEQQNGHQGIFSRAKSPLAQSVNAFSDITTDRGKILKTVFLALLLLSLAILATLQLLKPAGAPGLFSTGHPKTFQPPPQRPESFDEIISRLSSLETAMGSVASASDTSRSQSEQNSAALSSLQQKLVHLSTALDTQALKSKQALDGVEKRATKQEGIALTGLNGVQDEVHAILRRLKKVEDFRSDDADDIRWLKGRLDSVGKELGQLTKDVTGLSKDVKAGVDRQRILDVALEAIEKHLPAQLAVKVDKKTGKVEVQPAFWRHLTDAFVQPADLGKAIGSSVSQAVSSVAGSSAPVGPSSPPVPTWPQFLAENERSLKALIESDLSERVSSQAIVSRKTFLDTLRREIKQLKVDFEAKANENVQKIGEEILAKVAKQEQMKKDGSLASHLNPFARPDHSKDAVIKTADGQNLTHLVSAIVDSALLRYSKDLLAQPDFALYSAGGRVIPTLTSETYRAHPASKLATWLASLTGNQLPEGPPPAIALHADNHVGACWPFAGSSGQLGIALSRKVVATSVTLEHASADVSLDGTVSSAPKDFELWAVVQDAADVQRLKAYRRQLTEADDSVASSVPPSEKHLLLAVGSYDGTATNPVQTFPVTAAAKALEIPVQVVILKILSNHGSQPYTCLYRVRVGGVSVDA